MWVTDSFDIWASVISSSRDLPIQSAWKRTTRQTWSAARRLAYLAASAEGSGSSVMEEGAVGSMTVGEARSRAGGTRATSSSNFCGAGVAVAWTGGGLTGLGRVGEGRARWIHL